MWVARVALISDVWLSLARAKRTTIQTKVPAGSDSLLGTASRGRIPSDRPRVDVR